MTDVENQQNHLLTEPEDIYGALRRLLFVGKPVNVHIDGVEQVYTTIITSTDLKSRSFFMERVSPDKGNDYIRAGNRFAINSDYDGVRINFRLTGRLMYQPQKGQYRAEFPDSVYYLQRRGAYRAIIPSAHQIYLYLQMSDEEGDLTGQLLDISSTGFKAIIKANAKKRIEEQRHFSVARLRFNRKHDLDCSIKAQHTTLDPKGNTVVGFAFKSISGAAERYLNRLITELQWEERVRREQLEEAKGNEEIQAKEDSTTDDDAASSSSNDLADNNA